MSKLNLLFTKDGLQCRLANENKVKAFFPDEESPADFIDTALHEVLEFKFSEVSVISALNHFTLTSNHFKAHDLGYKLIGYNAPVAEDTEELMLTINKKYALQFYYTFPKTYYQKIKSLGKPVQFNFSGEKFLNTLQANGQQEMHIHLYHHQCEFIALRRNQVILYNNLDVRSEVDFLYFIMFTLKQIHFETAETKFFLYGELGENQTFVSELAKFVGDVNVVKENSENHLFIFN